MEIRAFLFDLDGTLANTLPLCIKIYKQAFAHYSGRLPSDEEVTTHFGLSEAGIFQRMLPEQWQEGLHYYHDLYERSHGECSEPFAGIEQALQLLQERGVKMGVVTGKGPHTAHLTLNYLGIAKYFDAVEAGKEDAIIKANAIRTILTQWEIEPRYATYIGDTDTDIQEAITAGVLPLAAAWAETATIHRLQGLQPFATFTTVEDFVRWLEQNVETIQKPASVQTPYERLHPTP